MHLQNPQPKYRAGLRRSLRRGFTLIETLVAVAIIMLAVGGPLAAASRGLASAQLSKDELVASYLAQDGMEMLRYIRDYNKLNSLAFTTSIGNGTASDQCSASNSCIVETVTLGNDPSTYIKVNASVADKKLHTNNNGFYTHFSIGGGAPESIYSRQYYITPISATEVAATVVVTWSDRYGADSVTLSENLMDR